MKKKLIFLFLYFIFWMLFFVISREIFLMANPTSRLLDTKTLFATLLYGARMDASLAAYFTAPIVLTLIGSNFFKRYNPYILIKYYTFVLVLFCLILICADSFMFKSWGNRIDSGFLKYLKNPNEAFASISNLPLFWILVSLAFVIAAAFYSINKFLIGHKSYLRSSEPNWLALLLLPVAGALVVPMRGGLQLAPLNQSSVYFSDNNFANQAAINAPWNFVFSLLEYSDEPKRANYVLIPEYEEKAIIASMFSCEKTKFPLEAAINRPNIIFVIWESLTAKVVGESYKGIEILPNLNRITNEGLYFSNAYASGDRTDKGVVAILSAYPAQPTTSIIKNPQKSKHLPQLGVELAKVGYTNAFYYGGELEFANIKSYIINGKMDKIVDVNDFEKKNLNSKWGAHDGVVAKKLETELNNLKQPFFVSWLTLSSHEPFETPDKPLFNEKDGEDLFFNSLHYTDRIFGEFVDYCKKQLWWKNTIIMVTGDHGHPLPRSNNKADDFRIPILLLGGALKNPPQIYQNTTSQLMIAPSILQLLDLKNEAFNKGKLFGCNKDWAFFSFKDGFGLVENNNQMIYDNVGDIPIRFEGDTTGLKRKGIAIQQHNYLDYIGR